jgi:hypothetical protein
VHGESVFVVFLCFVVEDLLVRIFFGILLYVLVIVSILVASVEKTVVF